ncbi:hypothetical protein RJT34_06662 [Clitoria ternatea]|uniref:chorismate mutase n=1 Tax=Clitoria ternatea TaxID=43366 RepID=A0AAN9PT62_CLITE
MAWDDGNYAQTAASDLSLLQAISRRIHYGKFVAEVKFRDSPQDYEPLIHAKAISRRIHYGKFVAEVKFRDSPQHYEPLIRAKHLSRIFVFSSSLIVLSSPAANLLILLKPKANPPWKVGVRTPSRDRCPHQLVNLDSGPGVGKYHNVVVVVVSHQPCLCPR